MGYLARRRSIRRKLSNQQDVVRNERRQSVENQPYGDRRRSALPPAVSRRTHPYYASRHRIARRHPGGEARRREELLQAVTTRPTTRASSIVGDIDKAATRALVEKYFGRSKRGQPVPKPSGQDAADHRASAAPSVQDRVELPRVYMAWLTSPIFTPGDADADIAASRARRRQVEPAVQDSSSTRSRSRRTSRRSSSR